MIELYEKKITYIIHISLDIVGGKHIWANELMIRNTVAELKLLNLPHKYFKIWFRIVRQKQVLKKFLMPFIERSVKETWTFSKFDFQGSNSKWDYWSFTLYSSLANLVILLLHSMKNVGSFDKQWILSVYSKWIHLKNNLRQGIKDNI